MHSQEQIEQALWEFIDGSCSASEVSRIAMLIEQDGLWAETYNELLAVHATIPEAMEPTQPHLRFTKNVMEKIAAAHPAPLPKSYINRTVIRGIAAFFIVTICAILITTLFAIDWSTNTPTSFTAVSNPPAINYKQILSPLSLNVIIGANVLLVLVLLDTALRSRRTQQH
jgi:hypothetical protein